MIASQANVDNVSGSISMLHKVATALVEDEADSVKVVEDAVDSVEDSGSDDETELIEELEAE